MIIEAWRIVEARHAATAFSGEGAERFGGRWNSRGVRVVYASDSEALAVLETLVHLNPPVPFDFVKIRIEFDDTLVKRVSVNDLPGDWQRKPPPLSSRAIGDAWCRSGESVVLAVPSIIVPSAVAMNYLLNPAHPDFSKIKITEPEAFVFDPRLLK